jgi:uncharacterized membrane protein
MDFSVSVDIAAPANVVWSVMSDVEKWPEWTASVRRVRRFDRGPLGLGSRALINQPKFPPAVWKVIDLDEGRRFQWQSGAPGMWVVGDHSVTATARGTRATLALHYSGIFGGLMARLTRGITERYLAMEAAGLKRQSELNSR